jgi:hypothetical protein
MAEEMQALGPDLSEAISYAKTMGQEEIEETIDYLINEVLSPSVTIVSFSHVLDRTQHANDPVSSNLGSNGSL